MNPETITNNEHYWKHESVNCHSHQHDRVSRVADTELILLIAHLIRQPGSIPGVGWVSDNQTEQQIIHNFLQWVSIIVS